MEFTPHTPDDIDSMLAVIGAGSIDELFEVIPSEIRLDRPLDLPAGKSETEVLRELGALAQTNLDCDRLICFAGAGTYDHRVPSFVWPLLGRGEFLTAYTPYQPELSQGVLQALFEYQSMVCAMTGMAVSNAGLYDGATALVEGVNLSVAATGHTGVVIAGAVHPASRKVLATQGAGLSLVIDHVPSSPTGTADLDAIRAAVGEQTAAVVVQHPNLLGCLEQVDQLAEIAHSVGARLVCSFDLALSGVLTSPGDLGADVVVADGGSFGNHLNFGGPSTGIIAVGEKDIRRLPGRLVGETRDAAGRRAFVLTLQAREQHIRREKATSNICTNQTLNTLAVAMTMAWLGPAGLRELGEQCVARAHYARERLIDVAGAEPVTTAAFGKEFAVRLTADAATVVSRASADHVLAGVPLSRLEPDAHPNDLLVAVTEQRSRDDIDTLAEAVARASKETAR
ncbi:MAG: aminomethyl-transferring glycine dehydrogenase subunit GcvPA [Actinomycetota bacterium]